ncbi:MAG: GIY-YIG nuclease family protein [Methanobacterium sp.]|uniref:GIY-YIG nuclease family protein n=1 Tax=Methanobacterium sp. TaxID=2164 RepID=UPI003D6591EA|nr:GIY-YIG nuclease family protein [Methanobacterium sp.]
MATYCLIIELNKNSSIEIGKLGKLVFKKGYYVYIGSALNSLDGRIKRHLSNEKKLFWHVDYLLNSPNSTIKEIILERSSEKWECSIAKEISKEGITVDRFGSSDCKCNAHLYYFENFEDAENTCLNSFKLLKLPALKY